MWLCWPRLLGIYGWRRAIGNDGDVVGYVIVVVVRQMKERTKRRCVVVRLAGLMRRMRHYAVFSLGKNTALVLRIIRMKGTFFMAEGFHGKVLRTTDEL